MTLGSPKILQRKKGSEFQDILLLIYRLHLLISHRYYYLCVTTLDHLPYSNLCKNDFRELTRTSCFLFFYF